MRPDERSGLAALCYKTLAYLLILLFIGLIYLTAAISSVYTLLPNVDEAWFTIPAYNLAENGFFGTSGLDETATFRQVKLDDINQ